MNYLKLGLGGRVRVLSRLDSRQSIRLRTMMLYLSFESLPPIKPVELTLQTITVLILEEVRKNIKSS